MKMAAKTHIDTDVIIIGGGMAGMTMAIGAAQIGLNVCTIDRAPKGDLVAEAYDGRSSAIAYASCNLLKGLGVWPHLEKDAQPILEIRVSDGPSLMHLHFDHETLGEGPLGNMIENRHMRIALMKRADDFDTLVQLNDAVVKDITTEPSHACITLADGTTISGKLLIGADGRGSQVRRNAWH